MDEDGRHPRISRRQAEDAAAAVAGWWPEIWRRWPWTRQEALSPVYKLVGDTCVALVYGIPQIQRSNQARWYTRDVQGTPAIYVLPPDEFTAQARRVSPSGDYRAMEGKSAVSYIYLVEPDSGHTEVAKTLLVSTETNAPYFQTQVAHEALNCFCSTEWDGSVLRSGLRRAHWGGGAMLQQGGALNDLLLDTLLLRVLPATTDVTTESLMNGMLGPYWNIVELYARTLVRMPVADVLFGLDASLLESFETALNHLLGLDDAVAELDSLLDRHEWQGLRELAERM